MSEFADYDMISKYYDSNRTANGAHHYLGLVYSLSGKTKENLHLLDMGCGTGNHIQFLLDQGLAKATIFDANPAMLERCKTKIQKYISEDRVQMNLNTLPELPYDDNTFDVVMTNQVLHHLTKPYDDDKYGKVVKALKEAYRVLKPNGVFIANLTTPDQLWEGTWWNRFMPEQTKDSAARVFRPKCFLELLRSANFTNESFIVEPLDLIFSKEWQENIEGPFSAEWRNIDSGMASCPEEELSRFTNAFQEMKDNGKLEEYVKNADATREKIGQYAIFYALKKD